jgi:hypothetical protein
MIIIDLKSGWLAVALDGALEEILAEPYGCVFCDSGKLRNPTKGHTTECGFGLAQDELSNK